MIAICSQFLCRVKVPLPVYSRDRGFHTNGVAIFGLFPVSTNFLLGTLRSTT